MKRWLYALLGLIVLLVAIVCLLPWWITPKQVEHLANRFLALDYEDGPDSRRAMLHTGPPSSDPDGCARTIVQVFLECLTESGFLYRSGPTDGRFVRRIRADD